MSILEWFTGLAFFAMGCTFFVYGCVLLADTLRWRLRARGVTGTLIGWHPASGCECYPVYRYFDALGQSLEVASDIGTEAGKRLLGSTVRLLVLTNPHRAREANHCSPAIASLAAFAGSLVLLGCPLTQLITYAAVTAALVAALMLMERYSSPAGTPLLASAPQHLGSVAGLLFGGVLFAGSAATVGQMLSLEFTGLHASGTVVRMNESQGSDGTEYHPVVRFNSVSGAAIEFEDVWGTGPHYAVGKRVPVLYLREAPPTAMIDGDIIRPLLVMLPLLIFFGLWLVLALGLHHVVFALSGLWRRSARK
jgi:hypothetical protein